MIDLSSKMIFFASSNKGKILEVEQFFAPLGIKIKSFFDEEFSDIEEDGQSFAENALLKANHVCQQVQIPTLADDSGLCIQSLENAPGIRTHRFAKQHGGFPAVFAHLEETLQHKAKEASFVCALALVDVAGKSEIYVGQCDGSMVFPPRGDLSFGYSPIFQPQGLQKTFAQMKNDERMSISHRGKALLQLQQAHNL